MRTCRLCQTTNPDTTAFCPVCGASLPAWNDDAGARLVDRIIGSNFRLVECIGEGAMGRVFRAEQLSLGRTVAVELLHPRLQDDEAFRERFSAEARAASCLNHANSVAVIDFGYADAGEPYIVMEFLRGRSLTDLVAEDFPLRPSRTSALCGQIASALEEAHALGVVHCDLKPDNIIVEALHDGREHVKVLDFGLARLQAAQIEAHAKRSGAGAHPLVEGSPGLSATLSGQDQESEVMGTPRYLSPERLRGKPPAPPQDIYALGVILYEMLCGAPPFSGSVSQVVASHLNDLPVPPATRQPSLQIPEILDAIALTCLAKDPSVRPSATELKMELERFVVARTPAGRVIPCSECGAPNRADARFCSECGAQSVAERTLASLPGKRAGSGITALADLAGPPTGWQAPEPGAPPSIDDLIAGDGPLESAFGEEVHTGVAAIPAAFESIRGPVGSLPFIGREQELDTLEALLLLGGDEVRVALLTGEAGVGKSRLCAEFAKRAEDQGFRVVRAEADAAPTARTLAPAATLAEALLGFRPADLAELDARAARGELDPRLVPGLRELFDLGGAPIDLERAVRMREVRTAFRLLVEGRADDAPVILLCDDVDRWDRQSLSLLADLANVDSGPAPRSSGSSVGPVPRSSRTNRPIAVCVTARARELAGFPQRLSRIPLPLLPPRDTRALAVAEAARRGFEEQTMLSLIGPAPHGLPLYVEQLGWCLQEGLLQVGARADANTLPDLVTNRLRDVPPAARRVLQHVVAAGMELDLGLLAACMEADAIRGGVAYLVDHGWLSQKDDAITGLPGDRLTVTHRLLQEVAYGTIPRGSLEETHARLATALEERGATPDLVAHQRYHAGEARAALDGLLAAGDAAEHRLDDHLATLWFRRAHDAGRRAMLRLEGEDDEQRFALASLKLAQALRFVGDLALAQAIAEEALGNEVDLVTRIGLYRVLAAILSGRGANTRARAELERALSLVERGSPRGGDRAGRSGKARPSAALVSEIYTELAATFVAEGRQSEAISTLERGREASAQLGGGRAPWRLVGRLAELFAISMERDKALQAFVYALDAAREAGSSVGLGRVGAMMAGFLDGIGDVAGAQAARKDAATALGMVGDQIALEGLAARPFS